MTGRRARALYTAALALMLALLAALWWAPGPLAAWRQWQAPPPQPPNLDDVRAALLRANPAAGALSPIVTERPLFNDNRRPVLSTASAASAPKAAPSPIEQARLQGVIAGPTLSGVMLEEGGKARFVRVGESVGDWKLARLHDRQAVFVRGGQERTLEWQAPAAAAASGAAPPSGAPAASGAAPTTGAAPTATNAAAGAAKSMAPVPPPARVPPPPAAPATTAPAPAPAASQPASLGSFGGGTRLPAKPAGPSR